MTTDSNNYAETDLKKLPMLGFFEERRSYPRINYGGDVIIAVAGKVLSGRVRTLSAEGMQIRCTPTVARAIHPRGTLIHPGCGPKLLLRFDLPVNGQLQTVAAETKLSYITPRSRDEIVFGINFTRISVADKKVLAGFILETMRPK